MTLMLCELQHCPFLSFESQEIKCKRHIPEPNSWFNVFRNNSKALRTAKFADIKGSQFCQGNGFSLGNVNLQKNTSR